MPSTPYDAKGLLKAAIRDDNPVMFIEHKMLYNDEGYVPDEDYVIPYGVADVKREGTDVTVVTYSRMVLRALEAAEKLAEEGISVEVVDLRTLKPLDMDTIAASVKKTGRVVGVSEAYKTGSFISELAMRIQEEVFDWLDAPVVRVAAADVPVPMSEPLEDAVYPQRRADHRRHSPGLWHRVQRRNRWQRKSFCPSWDRRWKKARSSSGSSKRATRSSAARCSVHGRVGQGDAGVRSRRRAAILRKILVPAGVRCRC